MRPISRVRFDALAGYAVDPRAAATGEQISWFTHSDDRVLGVVIRDFTDGDYAGIAMARDEQLQYRWTRMTAFTSSARRAEALLRPALEQAAMAPDEEHSQGHEKPIVVDFFRPVVAGPKLNADFLALINQEGFSPARGIIEPMMRWYDDVDGNFIEQFQSTAFDSRMWELYLFASLREAGYRLDRSQPAPDFIAEGLTGRFAIEAVTVNPTSDKTTGAAVPPPPLETLEQRAYFLEHHMPIKFGSALFSKFGKAYWTKPHVRDLPFALAIQDFSARGSMVFTRSALQTYLYGMAWDWEKDAEGRLTITPRRVQSHKAGAKEIPSGFFMLPGAENVSAVIFSNSGTISKFNRMGQLAGFGSSRVQMFREGFRLSHDPDAAEPLYFRHMVNDGHHAETWIEGLTVFHNPLAVRALHPDALPGAAHILLQRDGQLRSFAPDWFPLASRTFIAVPDSQRGDGRFAAAEPKPDGSDGCETTA